MDKHALRIVLGQLIDLKNLFDQMSIDGFEWEKMREYLDVLSLIIADLERVIDD